MARPEILKMTPLSMYDLTDRAESCVVAASGVPGCHAHASYVGRRLLLLDHCCAWRGECEAAYDLGSYVGSSSL